MIRRFLQLASRKIAFKRRLPKRFGGCSFYASPEGGLRYWRKNVENIDPPLLEAAADTVQAGDVVWDIGANVGLFSFAAAGVAGPGGRVYSVEPDTFLVRLLRRSAALRNDDAAPVEVLPVAVADSLALHTFRIAENARATNSLEGHGSTQTGGVRERQTVMTVSLDWLATQLPPPNVVKIDAEGAEARILRGGLELLRSYRPKLICEVCGENQEEVTRLLNEFGYVLYDGEQHRDERCPTPLAPWSTLAIPAGQ